MRVALDTNRYRDFCDGVEETVEILRLAEHIFVPFVTLAELRAGFLCGTIARRNENVLNSFLLRPRVAVLYPDEGTTHHYSRLYRQLREQGTPIPTNGLWIASLSVQHGLALCSRDAHFDSLPQLIRV